MAGNELGREWSWTDFEGEMGWTRPHGRGGRVVGVGPACIVKGGGQVGFIRVLQDVARKLKGRGTTRFIFFVEFFNTGMKRH
jgi:hypothetical protein